MIKAICLFYLVAAIQLNGFAAPPLSTVVVTINGIQNENGSLMVGLFNENDKWLTEPSFHKEIKVSKEKSMTVTFLNIPYGKYALSIYHDLDENGKLDTNFFKIPKEPFGFSNNYMPRFGPPSFNGASFEINQPQQNQVIELKTF